MNYLLDVEHSAIVADRQAADNVFVGAGFGVRHSPARRKNSFPMANGLLEAERPGGRPFFDPRRHGHLQC